MNPLAINRLAKLIRIFPAVAASVFVGVIYLSHVFVTFKYEHVNTFTNVEEWAYTNIAANNFLRFGFLNSLFLQDHSTSPYSEDHPFVYNHMPAGAENATALLLKLTDYDYSLTRFFFAAFMLPGLYFFVRFAGLLFSRISLRGAPLVLFVTSPFVILSSMEAQIHSVFLLLGFAPLVWLLEHADRGGRWRLWSAGIVLFILGIYVQYVLVAAIVFGLIYLWALKLANIKLSHVALGLGAISAAVIAHLLQNLAYFGPELFIKELLYTLGNRTVGLPSKEELHDFYQSINVVHHGSRPVDPGVFIQTILINLRISKAPFFFVLLSASVVVFLGVRKTIALGGESDLNEFANRFRYVLKLYVWACLTVLSVILIFPAFAQDVNLAPYGVNQLILGIPAVALILSALKLGHGTKIFAIQSADTADTLRWLILYLIALLAVLHFTQFGNWQALPIQMLVVFVFLGCVAWSWAESIDQKVVHISSVNNRLADLVRIGVFVIGAMFLSALMVDASQQVITLLREVRQPSYLEPLAKLKEFKGKLFMTNINLPTVGFFVEGPGFGVCGLDAVNAVGKLDSKECKISFVRRVDYWHAQQPDLFFFFWVPMVFPGFSDCIPLTRNLPKGEEFEGTCIGKLRHRLEINFPLVHSNPLFEVYDLKASASSRK